MRSYWTLAIVTACSLFASRAVAESPAQIRSPASAFEAPPPTRIALEAHVGDPSSQTAAVGPVLRELERRGFASSPASIIKLLGGRAPRPGIIDRGRTAEDIVAMSERGFDAFNQAEYRDALAILTPAVGQIKRNPGLLVLDAAHARTAFRAFIGLALSQAKLGYAADSVETMTELIRTFSTQTVSRAEYGPQAEQFYRAVQRQTQAMGRGQLAVTVDDPRALIFVNGELRGTGKIAAAGLIPGPYRVFIQIPGDSSRQYQIVVRVDDIAKLDVNWQSESALTVSDTWVGFAFANEAEQARESVYAGGLARQWEQETIIVVKATQFQGAQAVLGTMYRAGGHVARRALVVPSGDPAKLYALANFLADGTPSNDLRVIAAVDPLGIRAGGPYPPDDQSTVSQWPFFVGGAIGICAAIGLLAIDQDFGHTEHGMRTAYYRDTAPFGVAAGVAGAASIGVGLWLARRRPRSSLPTVSVAPSHVLIGWTVVY
jgi:hypothetical protein